MPVLNSYLNVVEAAEVLGVHPGTVKRLCREGRLVAEKINNAWLIHDDVLRDFAGKYSGSRGRPSNEVMSNNHLDIWCESKNAHLE